MTTKQATAFDLSKCARPNISTLKPYRCARDDYKDDGTNILLDANENAYGPGLALTGQGKLANGEHIGTGIGDVGVEVDLNGLNRYPDPHQIELKQLLCNLRNVPDSASPQLTPANLFVGVGSDEAIDALLRAFCAPGRDKILTCPPTYGMYTVSAHVNDVEVVHVPLDTDHDFAVRADEICKVLEGEVDSNENAGRGRVKLVYLCSPGNPTSTLVSRDAVEQILTHSTWNGLVIMDEAYVDFAPEQSSFAPMVTQYPNLVVMQTLSKAFGLAGIRLGAAFASPQVAGLLNNLKAPYNVSEVTSQLACRALSPKHLQVMIANRARILQQRERLIQELPRVKGIGRFRGGFDANFLLVEILDHPDSQGKSCNESALKVYEGLAEKRGVVVRFRGKEHGCTGCLRITVGTEQEVDRFLTELRSILGEIYEGKVTNGVADEERKEKAANNIVA